MTAQSSTPFSVEVVDIVLVQVSGEVEAAAVPELDGVLTEFEDRHCELDLDRVSFAGPATANALINRQLRAVAVGGSLYVVAASRLLRYLLQITETSALLRVAPDPPDTPRR